MKNLAEIACEYCKNQNFHADILPGCANFVSHCLQDAGYVYGIINYVPRLVEILKANLWKETTMEKAPRGSIVIFKETYDAVAPVGIGAEDDMTHVGIIGAGAVFYDFGGSDHMVRCQSCQPGTWWNSKIQMILAPPDSGIIENITETANLSYNKEAKEAIEWLKKDGILKNDHGVNDKPTWGELALVLFRTIVKHGKI